MAKDVYVNYAKLLMHEREGRDFAVTTLDRGSPVTVMAIHGGGIEPGTSEIARAIAGEDLNLYLFEGLKRSGNRALHISSAKFDEPRGKKMAQRSGVCVSVHGRQDDGLGDVCLGGLNAELRSELRKALGAAGFSTEYACRGLEGLDGTNLVNRCRRKGVQLEISRALRDQLTSDPALSLKFSRAVRSVVERLRDEKEIPGKDGVRDGSQPRHRARAVRSAR